MKITIDNIKSYYEFRGMKWPDTKEAIDFAITEIAEALDAYIRKHQSGWTRNNPDKDANLGHELADVYQMISIAAHQATGKTLDELLREKWRSKGYEEEKQSVAKAAPEKEGDLHFIPGKVYLDHTPKGFEAAMLMAMFRMTEKLNQLSNKQLVETCLNTDAADYLVVNEMMNRLSPGWQEEVWDKEVSKRGKRCQPDPEP